MTDTAGRNPPVMPPGRELDSAVQDHVINRVPIGPVPLYSTSWDAMRLVVERLVALHWEVNTLSADGCLPECYLVPDSENHYCGTLSAHGGTLPHAVALAALKAVTERSRLASAPCWVVVRQSPTGGVL